MFGYIKKYKWSLIWTLAILIATFLPKNDLPTIRFGIKNFDKIIHFGFYFILIILYFFESQPILKSSTWVIGFLICLALGIGTEFGQQFLQMGRSFEWSDMIANILGNISGLVLFKVLLIGRLFGK